MANKKKVTEVEGVDPIEQTEEVESTEMTTTNPALAKAMEMNERLKKLNTGLGIMPVALDILKEDMEELVQLLQEGQATEETSEVTE